MSGLFNIVNLRLKSYQETYRIQKDLVDRRQRNETADTLILVEHPPVFTIGKSGSRKNILVSLEKLEEEGIKIYETDRGGDITYHGPGQLVCYPIIDLTSYGKDIHFYLRNLEEVIIELLQKFEIYAQRIEGMTGVWVKGKKIASIGIGVSKWVTYHGLCFNIAPNMEHFAMINACGLGKSSTSVEEILGDEAPQREEIEDMFVRSFLKVFGNRDKETISKNRFH